MNEIYKLAWNNQFYVLTSPNTAKNVLTNDEITTHGIPLEPATASEYESYVSGITTQLESYL